MLGQFISCDGASAMHDLIRILRVQLAIGKPTPIPKWFNCTEEAFHGGTLHDGDIGYHVCENRGCHHTDTLKKKLQVCTKCQLEVYCSRECQTADWLARHKVC